MGQRLPSAVAAAAAATTTRDLRHLAWLTANRLGKSSLPQGAPLKTMSSSPKAARCGGADLSTTGRVAMEETSKRHGERLPLSEVVADCVKRWFHDTLKEARAGDVAMQVLVGQMYYGGYGVARNVQKGKAWISRASRCRPTALKVCDKRPGYNVSDSDSDELKDEAK